MTHHLSYLQNKDGTVTCNCGESKASDKEWREHQKEKLQGTLAEQDPLAWHFYLMLIENHFRDPRPYSELAVELADVARGWKEREWTAYDP